VILLAGRLTLKLLPETSTLSESRSDELVVVYVFIPEIVILLKSNVCEAVDDLRLMQTITRFEFF